MRKIQKEERIMKRFFTLLTAVSLLLAAVCGAAADGVTFSTAYFTLQLPDGWAVDTDDLEKEEGRECLGAFGDSAETGLVGVVYLVYYEDLKNVALWSSDESELQAYTESLLEEFADDKPESLGTVMAGRIPLVLIRGTDEDGEYLYADTLTNGYAIEFMAFSTDSEGEKLYPITEEQISQFRTILSTFQPVT